MLKKCFLFLFLAIGHLLYSENENNLDLAKKYLAEKSYAKAFEILTSEELRENVKAQNMLGIMYQLGQGVEISFDKAMRQYEKGAFKEDADAQFFLGMLHLEMQRSDEAIFWIEKAAGQNEHTGAQYMLGEIFLQQGMKDPKKYEVALAWFEKAAFKGNSEAQYQLANMYLLGTGIPKDYSKALFWYEKASDQHFTRATYELGVMYMNGEGVPRDLKKAANLFEEAASEGHAKAQCNIGIFYNRGMGVERNTKKALYWLGKAVSQQDEIDIRNAAAQEAKKMFESGSLGNNITINESESR
jgi:TPR repeat protein